ncbi:MAG: hypothetical protein NTX25_23330, partial [Proteobacteria bacterium]|nr:hypothetical protein [Pseudomonadota bacterium]
LMPLMLWFVFKANSAETIYGKFKPWITSNEYVSTFEDENFSKISILTGLFSLTPDADGLSFKKSEIKIFGLGWPGTVQYERCGYFNEGWEDVISYSKDYIVPSCKPNIVWQFYLFLQPISLILFRSLVLFLPLLLLRGIIKRDLYLLSLSTPIFTTVSVYFFFGLAISRYMYAIWPASVILSIVLFESLRQKGKGG